MPSTGFAITLNNLFSWGEEMSVRKHHRPITTTSSDAPCEQWVKQEIETYLNALHSYAERAARNPQLSFEQHLFSVVAGKGLMADHSGEQRDFEE